jgi:hypothetical protein
LFENGLALRNPCFAAGFNEIEGADTTRNPFFVIGVYHAVMALCK